MNGRTHEKETFDIFFSSVIRKNLKQGTTSKTWTRTLKNLDTESLHPEKPGPRKTWTLKIVLERTRL